MTENKESNSEKKMDPTFLFITSTLKVITDLVNSEFSRQATEKLADKRQEFEQSLEQQRQTFQREQLERQKEHQFELAQSDRKYQLELAQEQRTTQLELLAIQRETQKEIEELRDIYKNWPLRNIRPATILRAYQDQTVIPLRVIIAPPTVNYDSFGVTNKNFPNIEIRLAQGLRNFLGKYYPKNSTQRPVELLDGAWESRRYYGESAIKLLHNCLQSEPVLILESLIDHDSLHFRFAYWSSGQKNCSLQTIIADFPYREIMYESVKARALKWRETRDKLTESGTSPEKIKRLGGDNIANLKILEEEEEYRRESGLETQDLEQLQKHYQVSEQDFKHFGQFWANCHCLVTSFITDIHYLTQNNIPPLLPKLLPELTEDFSNPQLLEIIVQGYKQVYQALEYERPAWMPELGLDLANSLKYLPDKSWAREQIQSSIHSWLRVRGVTPLKTMEETIETMKAIVSIEDEKYFTTLQKCLTEIGDNLTAQQIKYLSAQYTFEFETLTVNSQGAKIKQEKKQAYYFVEDLGQGITLEMIAIPSGTFMMGSPKNKDTSDEYPKHKVTVSSFFMGKFTVTQKQWQAVASLAQVKRYLNPNPSHFQGDNRPIESVSWNDAVEFCQRLSLKTGLHYRLPTEAEWEYACRAGTTTPFYFGETITDKLANYYTPNIDAEKNRGETSSVGQFPPNAFGLYDMHGNVWEWCADIWHDNYVDAPNDGSAWTEGENQELSPLRGGSWLYPRDSCSSSFRLRNLFHHDDKNNNTGFRVVCHDWRRKSILYHSFFDG